VKAMNTERNLRRVLAVNAASSGAAAVAGAALAGPIGRLLDVPTAAVLVVAAALVPWVVAVAELARAEDQALRRDTPGVVAGDAAWVLGTAVLLVGGIVDRSGWWLLIPMAAAVAELGATQWMLWRTLAQRTTATAGLVAS
jgi:hypothetical protein